jgi:glucose uptake protein
MILPSTTLATLLSALLLLVCWSSWANLQRLTGRWRFELFYYDFTWGAVLVAVVAAFTLGSMNSQELTFEDNFLLTGYRRMAWAWGSGVIFNVGNLLLLGSMVVSGMSLAFPVALGTAAIFVAIWDMIQDPHSLKVLPSAGMMLLACGIALSVLSYLWHLEDQQVAAQKAFIGDPRTKGPARVATPLKGFVLALIGGIFIAISRPMMAEAVVGDNGVSSYGAALLFSGGMIVSTLLAVPFFLNFPVQGKPEQVRAYFKGTGKQHAFGIWAGIFWGAGMLASLLIHEAPPAVRMNPAARYILTEGPVVLAACWGLFVWREYKGISNRVQMMLAGMLVLLLLGIGVIGMAQKA